jgi:cytochrome oxidase Cu insertion factor (SCO1/SenC/PrrC family)
VTVSPRAKLLALFALFASPIAASLLAFHFYRPAATANYGELLPPTPVAAQAFGREGGGAFRFQGLEGRWALVTSDSGECAEACLAKLVTMRQVRLALGRNASRVARVLVIDDVRRPTPELLGAFPGLDVAITPAGMTPPPGAANDRAHIYVVDPRGNVMMRFPAAADGKRMLQDLNRLLKASQIG